MMLTVWLLFGALLLLNCAAGIAISLIGVDVDRLRDNAQERDRKLSEYIENAIQKIKEDLSFKCDCCGKYELVANMTEGKGEVKIETGFKLVRFGPISVPGDYKKEVIHHDKYCITCAKRKKLYKKGK